MRTSPLTRHQMFQLAKEMEQVLHRDLTTTDKWAYDDGWSDLRFATNLQVHEQTVAKVRREYFGSLKRNVERVNGESLKAAYAKIDKLEADLLKLQVRVVDLEARPYKVKLPRPEEALKHEAAVDDTESKRWAMTGTRKRHGRVDRAIAELVKETRKARA